MDWVIDADVTDILDEIFEDSDELRRRRGCQEMFIRSLNTGNAPEVAAILAHSKAHQYIYIDDLIDDVTGETLSMAIVRQDRADILKLLVEGGKIDPFAKKIIPIGSSGVSGISGDSFTSGGSVSTCVSIRPTFYRSFITTESTLIFGHFSLLEMSCRDARINCAKYILQLLNKPGDDFIASSAGEEMKWRHVYDALVSAVEQDKADVVRCIFGCVKGVDSNLNLDNDLGTALHVAARCNSTGSIEVLLSRDDIDIESIATDRMQTPLMIAAEYDHVTLVRRLLEAGAVVDRQTKECSSALIIACHFGHKQCVDVLLEYGADPSLKNPWDFTALYMGTDAPAILTRILSKGVDVNVHCGERGEVALHLAAVIGSITAVEALLDAGADINSRTVHNENALWLAVWKGHEGAARCLIQNNIDLDEASNGWQVFIWHYLPIEVALGLELYWVVRILLLAGCSLHNSRYFPNLADQGPLKDEHLGWIHLRPESFDYIRKNPEEMAWFKQFVTSPVSLKNACRRRIRKLLGKNIRNKTTAIPLPPLIKDYLMMTEL